MDTYLGAAARAVADDLTAIYADAFAGPPWNADAARVREFRERLERDVHRPGFRAVVAGRDGFASGWITRAPFPAERAYPRVVAQLGRQTVDRELIGAFEVDELAVRPGARGRSLGRRLLDAVTAGAPGGRAWLLTARSATRTVAFYRHAGWAEMPARPGTEDNLIVLTRTAAPTTGPARP